MAEEVVGKLGQHARIHLPDVDELLNIGYAVHASDDPSLAGTNAQKIAILIVERFLALTGADKVEAAYLDSIRNIALTYGRGITRRKQQWQRTLEHANNQRNGALSRIKQARYQNAALNFAWSLIGPTALGIFGYLVAQTVGAWLPDEVTSQTGNRLPSILMCAVFIIAGRTIAAWIRDVRRNMIDLQYAASCYEADLAYEVGKKEELLLSRKRLCEAWLQYTGEEFPETASYAMIMEGDIRARQRLEQHRQSFNRSWIFTLMRIARIFRKVPSRRTWASVSQKAA